MATISLILSGLALLAAITSLALTVRNEKRSQKRNTALINYVDEADAVMSKRVKTLEDGITPDYEKAKEAAEAMNNFNQGITNLLGYDPHEALRAQRAKEAGVSE